VDEPYLQTAKTPCPPETLIERGFSPAMVAALSTRSGQQPVA